ncbi:MAG TPA: hypothetical protein H9874_00240, partial [Candidatus Bilophila faecipullorum]|nr:hypothetical protein [Candidatus Bilophila faecipullorum]
MPGDVPRLADAFGHQNVGDDGIELADDIGREFRQRFVAPHHSPAQRLLHDLLAIGIEQAVRADVGVALGTLDHAVLHHPLDDG